MVGNVDVRVSVLLISEDSARCSPRTTQAIAKKLINVVDAQAQTHRISLLPLSPDNPGALAAHAMRWRSRHDDHRQARIELVKSIATQLAITNGFVFFHIDGDTSWGGRAESPNRSDFEKLMRGDLLRFLNSRQMPPQTIELCLSKLHLMMPFYSVEAWLYQNAPQGRRFCQGKPCGQHIMHFDSWEANRELLDEISKPKEVVCFGSKHNDHLAANSFPAHDVYAAGKSFAALVDELRGSAVLRAALRSTY